MPAFMPIAASYHAPPASTMVTSATPGTPLSGTGISTSPLAACMTGDFAGARLREAVAQPVSRERCHTLLPMHAPVEVQSEGRTVMHLHSELDRIGYLREHRDGAFWLELLDAVTPVEGCPANDTSRAVTSGVETRLRCLGAPPPHLPAPKSRLESVFGIPCPDDASRGASDFRTADAMAIPSIYIEQPGFTPGTMAGLEYDLGWWGLAGTRKGMPHVCEGAWFANPYPSFYRAIGRDVLGRLPTKVDPHEVIDPDVARILSLHSHAAGFADCLTNVTRVTVRGGSFPVLGADGAPETVAAIETTDFARECVGDWWRNPRNRRAGDDALTRRREACDAPRTTTAQPTSDATQTTPTATATTATTQSASIMTETPTPTEAPTTTQPPATPTMPSRSTVTEPGA